ncbi:MAG TPA: PIG-L family deacetylase [Tepidisphaeraceae bacterium]|jgi:LmbE family N-acetylglucosaminyl deacetylase
MRRTFSAVGLGRWLRLSVRAAIVGMCLLASMPEWSRAAEAAPSSAVLQELHRFEQLGSVLYVAAHPDDENTQLIAYLARGRLYRTAYLSLTRGDGGQNLLGPEFGDELGVIRTQELLAARRIDGGQQFFSRARDFGYSKDYRQTLRKWDHQQVLSDIVRVIREFRPDVMITRFSTVPGITHGHHTASAVLALEAFKICGDPHAFPEQLTELKPWQPKRIFLNGFVGFRRPDQLVPGATSEPSKKINTIRIDISGTDPVRGVPLGELAAMSRSMHKTQGFGNFAGYGRGGDGPRYESFQLLDGEHASKDILDGIDTTWNRFPGGGEIAALASQAIARFNSADLAANIPALLSIRSHLAALPADPVIDEKRRLLDHIVQECLGLEVETVIPQAEVVPGEKLPLHHVVTERSKIPVRWVAVRYPSVGNQVSNTKDLIPAQSVDLDSTQTLPANTPLGQPYWLREPETEGMFRVDDPKLIGRPENPPAFPVEFVFDVAGQTLVIADEPVQITIPPTSTAAQDKGETHRRLDVIAPVSLSFGSEVQLFPPGATRTVTVEATAFRNDLAGNLQLDASEGWIVSPSTRAFHLSTGEHAQLSFNITAPPHPTTARILARAVIGNASYSNQRVVIHYSHIPLILLQPAASLKAVSLDLAIRGHEIGYLPGAGDSVADILKQMGYAVTSLTGADLTPKSLSRFDAVVIGIRAFNVRTDLAPHLPALFAYVQAGGTVIEQYNTPNGLQTTELAPYDLELSRDLPHNRVTDEKAPVTLLVPDHLAFTTPNRIVPADFDGWVQERGLNFPSKWDTTHFTALLACSDAGEAPLTSGLLVAHYGKGYFVYTGLSWFRQLPAGVPGACRLFANLVSLGK